MVHNYSSVLIKRIKERKFRYLYLFLADVPHKCRQACSSHHQIVNRICFWFCIGKTQQNYQKDSETAMLSRNRRHICWLRPRFGLALASSRPNPTERIHVLNPDKTRQPERRGVEVLAGGPRHGHPQLVRFWDFLPCRLRRPQQQGGGAEHVQAVLPPRRRQRPDQVCAREKLRRICSLERFQLQSKR